MRDKSKVRSPLPALSNPALSQVFFWRQRGRLSGVALVVRCARAAITPIIKAFTSEDREAGRTVSAPSDVAKFVVLVVGAYEVIVGRWGLGSLLAFLAYHR